MADNQEDLGEFENRQEKLARLERDIIEGERLAFEQALLIEELARKGQDVTVDRELLEAIQAALKDWYAEKDLIQKLYH